MAAAYAEALGRGDAEHAYQLLAAADRKAIDPASYLRALRENPAETRQLATSLGQVRGTSVQARVQLEDGSELVLVLEGDHFRVVDPLTRFYGQESPRAALCSFVRAVERSRWDVVLALMPESARGQLDADTLGQRLRARREELTRMTALLSRSLDAPIEIVGDRATMPYGESYTARLVREHGLWKLEDPE